jgi:hypothetical protein
MYTHTLFLYFTATIFACECAYMAGTEVRGTAAGPVSPSRSPATNSGHAIIRTKQDHLCAKQRAITMAGSRDDMAPTWGAPAVMIIVLQSAVRQRVHLHFCRLMERHKSPTATGGQKI